MKLNASHRLALVAAALIVIWFAINTVLHIRSTENSNQTVADNEADVQRPSVVIKQSQAEPHANIFTLYGRSEANREVVVRAKTAGPVVRTPAQEGGRVKTGDLLCRQDVDARKARLDQAKATLRTHELDLKSTQTLIEKGYKSEIQLANIQAAVDGAQAAVKQAEIELGNINIRAPFSGIFETRMAEVGDYLAPGSPCALIVELSPLVIAVQLTETQLGAVSVGDIADVALATGETFSGELRFIEAKANPSTRTFGAEIRVPNDDYALKAGVTATVRLKAGIQEAHYVPAKILTLNADGSLGIRYLDADNRVSFTPVTTIDEDQNGLWVTGLPDTTRIIIEGQDFVSVGTVVDPRTHAGGL